MDNKELKGAVAAIAACLNGQTAGREDATGGKQQGPIGRTALRPISEIQVLAAVIDHTQLRPEATQEKIDRVCDEALEWNLGVVCVNPTWVALAPNRLRGSRVKVATVCGFPIGATLTTVKRREAEAGMAVGAQEIDMVMNIGAMKSGDYSLVEADIRSVVEACHPSSLVKVILENCYLTEPEKREGCKIAQNAGADFVKTSTGFGASGATVDDVRLMRETVGPDMGVKAAGGIRTLADALRMLQAGATRLGTSSGHTLIEEAARLMNGMDK